MGVKLVSLELEESDLEFTGYELVSLDLEDSDENSRGWN